MAESHPNTISRAITAAYFGITFILVIAEILAGKTSGLSFDPQLLLFVFKPLLIPSLMLLYFFTSKTRSKLYFAALFFAMCSNIFFLSVAPHFLLYGMLAFMFYRILSIVVVLKLIKKIPVLPFLIACVPFVFIFSCLINLTMNALGASFYPVIVNGILISILSGISLSNYILDDSRNNSWLAISTLLAIVLVYLFMIQKYYLPNDIFQPMSALIFAGAHYAYYKFVVISENQKTNGSLNDDGPALG